MIGQTMALMVGPDVAIPVAVFTMVIFCCWFGTRTARAAIRAQAEVRQKLIDKFGSAQELSTFLESRGGQQFLAGSSRGRSGRIASLAWGLILTILGVALVGLAIGHRIDVIPGVIALAVGIALLILSAILHKLAAKTDRCCGAPGRQNLPI